MSVKLDHVLILRIISKINTALQVILRLHYRGGPNRAEPNRAGPAVQTMLALLYKPCWPGLAQLTSAQFYDCLHCQTNWADPCWPTKMCQCKRSIILCLHWHIFTSQHSLFDSVNSHKTELK